MKRKISSNTLLCLISGILFGLIIHLYMLTNKLPNSDDLSSYYAAGATLSSGRWLLDYLSGLSGIWSIPWVNGFMGILYLSISACFIAALLHMKHKISFVLIPLMIISFPSVISIYTYMFTADLFFLSFLLNSIGVYCTRKYRFGFLYGAVFFAFGLGIYQSFICLAAALLVMTLIFDLLSGKDFHNVIKMGFQSVLSLLLGVLLYFIILQSLLHLKGIGLNDYQGISQMGILSLRGIPYQVFKAYAKILSFFLLRPEGFYRNPFIWSLNILACICCMILFIKLISVKRLHKDRQKLILLGILVVLFPLAASFIYVMAPQSWVHLIMKFQYCLIYIMVIGLLDLYLSVHKIRVEDMLAISTIGKNPLHKFGNVLCCSTLIVILLIGYHNYLLANKTYFLLQLTYERIYSFYTKMSFRMEETEGYQWGDPIAIIGTYPPDVISHDSQLEQEISGITGIITPDIIYSETAGYDFLKDYIGMNTHFAGTEKAAEITTTTEWKSMPCYPASASVRMIGDVCVVKISEVE